MPSNSHVDVGDSVRLRLPPRGRYFGSRMAYGFTYRIRCISVLRRPRRTKGARPDLVSRGGPDVFKRELVLRR
jgi:hypothetical protein